MAASKTVQRPRRRALTRGAALTLAAQVSSLADLQFGRHLTENLDTAPGRAEGRRGENTRRSTTRGTSAVRSGQLGGVRPQGPAWSQYG